MRRGSCWRRSGRAERKGSILWRAGVACAGPARLGRYPDVGEVRARGTRPHDLRCTRGCPVRLQLLVSGLKLLTESLSLTKTHVFVIRSPETRTDARYRHPELARTLALQARSQSRCR